MSRRSDPTSTPANPAESGFTLIEVMVAMTILAIVLLGFLSTRSQALADAIQARNWRLARSIAEEQLSKLQAGAHEVRPEPSPIDVDGYPGFRFVVLIGEQAIANAEAEIDSQVADNDGSSTDRRLWQRERDDLRTARRKGINLDDYRRQQLQSENDANTVPSEDDFEEVAVIVYFPNVSLAEDVDRDEETFTLKARVSTLAINGLTPDQADGLAAQKGLTTEGGGDAGGGASLTAGGSNSGK
ncbi:MAG: prepilin-type N-terminal cleavage/methylation domain-containing protein [Planctomycetota bacterium]